MKEIKPLSNSRDAVNTHDKLLADQYYLDENDDGLLKCSCGRRLVVLEDGVYQCTGGFPIYSLADGDVVLDKFGNIMLKKKPHPKKENDNV